MKKKPQVQAEQFDPDRFIHNASTVVADQPQRSRGAKVAAQGFIRTSFDLPEDLYERLKIFAVRQRRPMRQVLEGALSEFLDREEA